MQQIGALVINIIETSGLFAPLLFISFHLLRPLFLLPVAFICISGGILFGAVIGSIYSLIGVTLSSFLFYKVSKKTPQTVNKLITLKTKLFGKHSSLSAKQIAILRLVPFINFHLLSVCVMEMSVGLKEYMRNSFYTNIPLAIVYTSAGQWLSRLSPVLLVLLLLLLFPIFHLMRRKEFIIKWNDFFQAEGAK
ncbi:TVP38/TMEM64 family protein [Pontibacillus litoralis]|uniref:TVP38/TMEM64 family membrane protein n=1 Tax=Pontibacillus litoralis JSM 072002 TaxID=1385512 RepID=A0A0A5GD95_9BACI|nr:VTT domain-containing protein [Pontibacillus litoralis]KGX89070.1 alkaline phosphatase [Pontibacillus litoralis JSM 072002]